MLPLASAFEFASVALRQQLEFQRRYHAGACGQFPAVACKVAGAERSRITPWILNVRLGIVCALEMVDDLDDEALVEALARLTMGVDFDTPAQELYQPPPASSTLQTKVSWENYTEASSECVQRWWGHLTEEWAELRGHAYLPFRGPGREEIVDDCLGRLRDLNEGKLRGRNNCCVLGPKDIGKTCVLKALVCLNSVLSSDTLSIFLDGRAIEHRLSELIVRGLDARYPQLMAKVSAKLTIAGWDKDLSFVVKVLRVIKTRVFVVLDEIDSVFKRPEQGHVLRELLQLGEDSKDVLVYLAAADTRARVLVTGKLPAAERNQFESYTGVSLNHTKYRFLNQRALQFSREGFQDAVRQFRAGGSEGEGGGGEGGDGCGGGGGAGDPDGLIDDARLEELYVSNAGRISALARNFTVDQARITLQTFPRGSPAWCGLDAFWTALTASKSTLVKSFQANPFQAFDAASLAVELSDVMFHLADGGSGGGASASASAGASASVVSLFYDLSDQHLLYFNDMGPRVTLSLVHPRDISTYVLVFGATTVFREIESLLSPGADLARDINEPIVAEALATWTKAEGRRRQCLGWSLHWPLCRVPRAFLLGPRSCARSGTISRAVSVRTCTSTTRHCGRASSSRRCLTAALTSWPCSSVKRTRQ